MYACIISAILIRKPADCKQSKCILLKYFFNQKLAIEKQNEEIKAEILQFLAKIFLQRSEMNIWTGTKL